MSGPSAARESTAGEADQTDQPRWWGEWLGLPAEGVGSVAGFGRRCAGLFVDWLPCTVAAQLLTTNPAMSALALFAAYTLVAVALFGRTAGHAVAGIRVTVVGGGRVGFGPAAIRTVLLCLAVPPLVINADGRGWHDRATNTVVLRTR